ncbi:hypothetical protein D8674_030009 [Pyrus ussuriensis x Pyrus communis]|uniref:Uncharacterized protein n=1 Tax=Pyrus ussuriensis x Pyrus communis TaxID=2448454 RepID=A0A5N5I5Q9_9ROSA|nr:hypothetical protein D8674_030009 [Pyrus ussuriensis x Pyrus communis]
MFNLSPFISKMSIVLWCLQKEFRGGRYFLITTVQRFKLLRSLMLTLCNEPSLCEGKRIENGVYFRPFRCLTFEGRFPWKERILAFIFESIRIKIGPLKTLEIGLGQKDDREPSTKDPFFIWFYIDEGQAVGRGKRGGTAFWCRCRRVIT